MSLFSWYNETFTPEVDWYLPDSDIINSDVEDRETSLPQPSNPEVAGSQGYQEYLQNKLNLHAENRVRSVLNFYRGEVQDYSPTAIPAKADNSIQDNVFDLRRLYELRKAGVWDYVVSVPKGETKTISRPQLTLTTERLSDTHFVLRFPEGENLDSLRDSIIARIRTNSASRVLDEAVRNFVQNGDNAPTQNSFRPEDDLLATTVVLQSLNLLGRPLPLINQPDIDPDEIAAGLLTKAFMEKAIRGEDGKIASVRLELDEGVQIILEPAGEPPEKKDVLTTNWTMRIVADPSPYMMETANQSPGSKCESFINRPTGREFIRALEESQMRFSPNFEDFLITGRSSAFDDRYGGAYSQISRVLAKIIHSGDISRLDEVLVSASGDHLSRQQLEKLVQFESHDKGFQVFQDILKQILSKSKDKSFNDPNVTSSRISIKAGACFDVVSYYAQAQNLGKLYNIELFGKSFLQKTHGARTFINTGEFPFNGISLPRGSLFVKGDDGGLAFLRLTPFMFDSRDDMVSSFGTEIIKAERNEGNIQAVVGRIKYS